MKIPREIKKKINETYKGLAKSLYMDYGYDYPAHHIRLMIADTITSHALSKTLEDVTTAKRVTKNKVTREVNKKIANMPKEELEAKKEKLHEKANNVEEYMF